MKVDDAATEFQSYLFFLRHFCELIWAGRAPDREPSHLIQCLVENQTPLVAHLTEIPPSEAQTRELRKYMFTAWNSEAVARLSAVFDSDVRQFTNQWKPVQSYYAIYF